MCYQYYLHQIISVKSVCRIKVHKIVERNVLFILLLWTNNVLLLRVSQFSCYSISELDIFKLLVIP